jgi:hypothetical protein
MARSPLDLDFVGFRHTSQHREDLLKRKSMHLGRPTCGGVLEAATMAEIAARADARIGSLYRFFPSKEAVAMPS